MTLLPDPRQPSFHFSRNVLVFCGLLFLNGLAASSLVYLWGMAFLEHHIFSGPSGALLLQAISIVPNCVVAVVLGAALSRFIDSPHKPRWAAAFALCLGLFYFFSVRYYRPPELLDTLGRLAASALIAASVFGGYVAGSKRVSAAPPGGTSAA